MKYWVRPVSEEGKEQTMKYLLTFCLICIAAVCWIGTVQGVYEVGDHVEDFTLNDAYGNPVSLYDFIGTAILLNLWQSG
jgi:cytochrome oxidase Cu insertion factor (SCO1/SenC/PrrC family)